MKTVQEYLKILNKEKLIDTYYEKIKNEIFECKNKDITLKEFEDIYKNNISDFIDHLIKLEPKKKIEVDNEITFESDQGIIFAYDAYSDDFMIPTLTVGLIYKQDLEEQKLKAKTYAYEFLPQNEIITFLIADNNYTQENIYEVMSDVLYESSFFGYYEESKEKHRNELNKSIEEIKSGNCKLTTWEDFKNDLELKEDQVEEDLRHQAINIIIKCNEYLYEKELKILINSLE